MQLFQFLFGTCDYSLKVFFTIIILNEITRMGKKLFYKSEHFLFSFKRLIQIICYFIVVILANLLDLLLGNASFSRNVTLYFFIVYDGMQILKNCGCVGIPLPKKLYETLEKLVVEEEEENGKT